MLTTNDAQSAMGATLYGSEGEKVGKIGQIYLNDTTGEPEFATVNTGMFGTHESFVPLSEATMNDDGVTVPFAKDTIKDAPSVEGDGHLEHDEEQSLYAYYGLAGTSTTNAGDVSDTRTDDDTIVHGGTNGYDAAVVETTGDRSGRTDLAGTAGIEGHDTSGPTTDEAMTRSEEQLEVGTRTQESGRARLRKYVTTEQQTVTVPVSREYAVLTSEPITEDNVDSALGGGDITEEEHEVLLSEEVVVVEKKVKPVERVRLGTETRTQDETVTEEVRKENIEVEGDVERA